LRQVNATAPSLFQGPAVNDGQFERPLRDVNGDGFAHRRADQVLRQRAGVGDPVFGRFRFPLLDEVERLDTVTETALFDPTRGHYLFALVGHQISPPYHD